MGGVGWGERGRHGAGWDLGLIFFLGGGGGCLFAVTL